MLEDKVKQKLKKLNLLGVRVINCNSWGIASIEGKYRNSVRVYNLSLNKVYNIDDAMVIRTTVTRYFIIVPYKTVDEYNNIRLDYEVYCESNANNLLENTYGKLRLSKPNNGLNHDVIVLRDIKTNDVVIMNCEGKMLTIDNKLVSRNKSLELSDGKTVYKNRPFGLYRDKDGTYYFVDKDRSIHKKEGKIWAISRFTSKLDKIEPFEEEIEVK